MKELQYYYRTKYQFIVGILPTGWAFGKTITSITKRTFGNCTIFSIPYRFEHYILPALLMDA